MNFVSRSNFRGILVIVEGKVFIIISHDANGAWHEIYLSSGCWDGTMKHLSSEAMVVFVVQEERQSAG
eukprot:scaffold80038_cov62-Cyclotella_meneghiniana.AAC.1